MKKRIIAAILTFVIISAALCTSACSGKAPELESVKDRFVYLIENSKGVNSLFFGRGLPIYDREGILAQELGIYYDDDMPSYNKIMENTRYISVEQMKLAAEKVYSKEYLESIYETAFEGYLTGASSAYIRFYEDMNGLYQSRYATDFKLADRIYDYSTIEIVKPSSDEYINITVETYTLDDPVRRTIRLSFIFENGNWYLDSPTY